MTDQGRDIITLAEAVRVYRRITGQNKSRKTIDEEVHRRPHLGVWKLTSPEGRPVFQGIDRARWEYFLRTRLALQGVRNIFFDMED